MSVDLQKYTLSPSEGDAFYTEVDIRLPNLAFEGKFSIFRTNQFFVKNRTPNQITGKNGLVAENHSNNKKYDFHSDTLKCSNTHKKKLITKVMKDTSNSQIPTTKILSYFVLYFTRIFRTPKFYIKYYDFDCIDDDVTKKKIRLHSNSD